MRLVEAIQLLKSRPAASLSAAELAELKTLINEQPSLPAAVGGRTWVDQYLAAAEAAIATRPPAPAEPLAAAPSETLHEPMAPVGVGTGWSRRRVIEVAFFALLLLGAGTWVGILLLHGHPSTPAVVVHTPKVPEPPHNEPAAPAAPIQRPPQPVAPPAHSTPRPKPATPSETNPSETSNEAQRSAPPADHPRFTAWQGWKVEPGKETQIESKSEWDLIDPSNPRPLLVPITTGTVRLVYEGELPTDARLVMVNCRQVASTARGSLSLWIDGKSVLTQRVTEADDAREMMLPLPSPAAAHRSLALVYTPGHPQEQVAWRGITVSTSRAEVMPAGVAADAGEPDASSPRLRVWLRADSGIRDGANRGPTQLGFDGQVQTWEDRSAAGRHFTSDTGDPARRPNYSPNDSGLGGRPAVNFDGAKQYLRYSVGSMYDTAASTTVVVFRLTHIHRVDRKRGSVVFATTEPRVSLSFNNGAQVPGGHSLNFSAPAAINMTVDPRLDNRFAIAILKTDGAASYLELNGLRVPGQQSAGRSGADFVLGLSAPPPPGSNNYPTGIAELMIYDRALSDIETRQIAQYLQRRYGIAAGR